MNLALMGRIPFYYRQLLFLTCASSLVLFCFTPSSEAKVKSVYKLLVTDYRGNRWIDYTAVDASTYVTYNGGTTFIKNVQVLAHWKIKNDESLYGKSIINTKKWSAKRPETEIASATPIPSILRDNRQVSKEKLVASSRYTKTAIVHRNHQRLSLAQRTSHQEAKEFAKFKGQEEAVVSDLLSPASQLQSELVKVPIGSGSSSSLIQNGRSVGPTVVNADFQLQPNRTGTLPDKNLSREKSRDNRTVKPASVSKITARKQQLNGKVLGRVNRYKSLIRSAAKDNDLDPELLIALVYVESGGDYRAVSPKKASGLTQLMAGTAKDLGVTNVFDPKQNISGGARYLKQQMDSFGQVSLALAAYNAGPTRVKTKKGLPSETQRYIQKVLQVKKALEAQ